MSNVIASTLTFERLKNWLLATFAGPAVLLSLVGLYGIISHEVEAFTPDIACAWLSAQCVRASSE